MIRHAAHLFRIVGHHKDADTMLLLHGRQQLIEFRNALLVHTGSGLIQDHQLRRVHQRPGQQHSLLLPAGKLTDEPAAVVRHAHLRQCLQRSGLLLFPRKAEESDAAVEIGGHQLQHRRRKVLAALHAVLPHKAHSLPAPEAPHILPEEPDLAPVLGLQLSQKQLQQRALSRAVLSQQDIKFSLPYREADALQHLRVAVRIGEMQIPHGNDLLLLDFLFLLRCHALHFPSDSWQPQLQPCPCPWAFSGSAAPPALSSAAQASQSP